LTPSLRDKARAALEQVAGQVKSRDVREIVEKALG
jgi:aminopeptidase N